MRKGCLIVLPVSRWLQGGTLSTMKSKQAAERAPNPGRTAGSSFWHAYRDQLLTIEFVPASIPPRSWRSTASSTHLIASTSNGPSIGIAAAGLLPKSQREIDGELFQPLSKSHINIRSTTPLFKESLLHDPANPYNLSKALPFNSTTLYSPSLRIFSAS